MRSSVHVNGATADAATPGASANALRVSATRSDLQFAAWRAALVCARRSSVDLCTMGERLSTCAAHLSLLSIARGGNTDAATSPGNHGNHGHQLSFAAIAVGTTSYTS